jgi:hypothetical protein
MRTADLIDHLAQQLKPARRAAPALILAAGVTAGAVVAAALMMAGLGLRPDLAFALHTAPFWLKLAYTLALTLAGFALVDRAGRPGARLAPSALALGVTVAVVGVIAAVQMIRAPSDLRSALFLGGSHKVCPWMIVGLSLPIIVAILFAARRMAPTRPMLAGGAAGLLAGATAATVYTFHCNETSAMFLAVWYTLGVALAGAIGAVCGRFALRW